PREFAARHAQVALDVPEERENAVASTDDAVPRLLIDECPRSGDGIDVLHRLFHEQAEALVAALERGVVRVAVEVDRGVGVTAPGAAQRAGGTRVLERVGHDATARKGIAAAAG